MSDGYVVANPKENTVDLEITYQKSNGEAGKVATLKPGTQITIEDRKLVQIREVHRPSMLVLLSDGTYNNDRISKPVYHAR